MSDPHPARIPSLVKKYLMAVSGFVFTLFVLGHMLGNLQIFAGSPGPINRYSDFLHSLGELLWLVRLFLIGCLVVHVWMAILLTRENRRARGPGYVKDVTVQASLASRTMIWSGGVIFAFLIIHLADYTLQTTHPIFKSLEYVENGRRLHDVYAMVLVGFSNPAFAAFYVFAVGLLCLHLSHGVSSMFQTLGVRNEKWRGWLNHAAIAYGLLIFLGFVSVPVSVQMSLHSARPLLPVQTVLSQVETANKAWSADTPTPVVVNYFLPADNASTSAPAPSATSVKGF